MTWVGPGVELGREGGDSLIKGTMQCNVALSREKKAASIIGNIINNS